MDCGFFDRELTEIAHKENLVFMLQIDRLLMPGRGRLECSSQSCGDCFDEILDLTSDLDEHTIDAYPDNPTEEFWEVEECAFCGGGLDQERAVLGYSHEMQIENMVDREHLLCLDCLDIVKNFLQNVPESTPDGDIYIGVEDDEIKTSLKEADFDNIANEYHACHENDYIRFEAHYPSNEVNPAHYTEASGMITQLDTRMGQTRMVVTPPEKDIEYHIYDNLGRDRSLDARVKTADGSIDGLGQVTVFEIVDP